MAVTVETLEKLERKIRLVLPVQPIQAEVDARLRKLARTVKMDGFRPGKVPMPVVTQRYGYSIHYEVMNDQVGRAFAVAAAEAGLRVAGQPRIQDAESAADSELVFDAVFEVFPEIKFGDLSAVEIERVGAEVSEAAIDKTLDILRKQRRSFQVRGADEPASDGDRVSIDFEGKIDGEPFEGGKASDFQFVVGEGQMLKEFEDAVRGMTSGDSKTFPLSFPEDYHGKDVAGKQADFLVTVKQVEAGQLPAVDEAFVQSLGVASGTLEALRSDIRTNLEREVRWRLLSRNKQAALDALVAAAELELPKVIVQAEVERLAEQTREDMKQRGIKGMDTATLPPELFVPQAEKRVRMGLVVAELVKAENLQATPAQVQAQILELAASYERPEDVVGWYTNDPQRKADVEALVVERNVTEHVLAKAKINDKVLSFEELMGQA